MSSILNHIMKESKSQFNHTVILNATNVGRRASGIANYTLSLLKEFSYIKTNIRFIVYLNKNSEERIREIHFPENFTIKWAPRLVSPDYNFKGHLLRLLYSNYLSLRYRKILIFNTSQMEAIFFRRNQVITIHDLIPLLFREHHKRQYYYFKYFIQFALRAANYVITPSTHSKELVQRFYGLPANRIRIIPHGIQNIDKDKSANSPEEKDVYILFIGRICPMKNVVSIIQAFNDIKHRIPHNLVIVGEGKDKLETEIKAGRLTKSEINNGRIIIKGYVSDDEIPGYYERASLFVFPSLYEGFGLPPLEAMSCGCPVVVSHTASLPEECGEAAYYVDPHSVKSIAQGMYEALTNPYLRQNLINKGFERAAIFNWKSSALEHLMIVQETLYGHREPLPFMTTKNLPVPEMTSLSSEPSGSFGTGN
jgi:glycosyltransferase involved in cell wall biosynthesis